MNPAMHALSLYLDTSVIGGYYDAEFMADTRALWRLREAGRFRFVSSVLVDQEIARAPEPVRALMRATFAPADMLPMDGRGAGTGGPLPRAKGGAGQFYRRRPACRGLLRGPARLPRELEL